MPLNTAIFAPIFVGLPNNSGLLRTKVRLDIHKNFDNEQNLEPINAC